MRKQWHNMPDTDGCTAILFFILAVVCWPLALIFIIVYGIIKDSH